MLAALADRFVSVDDGVSGIYRDMLRITGETHQQEVARTTIFQEYALKAWLAVERSFKLTVGRRTAVSFDIHNSRPNRTSDMDRNASAIKTKR